MSRNLLWSCAYRIFQLGQALGFNVTLNHHYFPLPDVRRLKDDIWLVPDELAGIDINEQNQIELLSHFESSFKGEYDAFPRRKTAIPYEYYSDNPYFGCVDGEILYCFIRHFKPQRLIEVGSGYSTFLAAKAISQNQEEDPSYVCDLTAIEPQPGPVLEGGFPNLTRLVRKQVQDVPYTEFQKLTENDILFIDSSHGLTIGSDVQYEYLRILPHLNNGVIVQVHDIFLPLEYPKEWVVKRLRFWNEQYLLQAFLMFNDAYEVLWAAGYMHSNHPDLLEKAFSSYSADSVSPSSMNRPRPVSFWMRRVNSHSRPSEG
jgi:Methyltransferase domain